MNKKIREFVGTALIMLLLSQNCLFARSYNPNNMRYGMSRAEVENAIGGTLSEKGSFDFLARGNVYQQFNLDYSHGFYLLFENDSLYAVQQGGRSVSIDHCYENLRSAESSLESCVAQSIEISPEWKIDPETYDFEGYQLTLSQKLWSVGAMVLFSPVLAVGLVVTNRVRSSIVNSWFKCIVI